MVHTNFKIVFVIVTRIHYIEKQEIFNQYHYKTEDYF